MSEEDRTMWAREVKRLGNKIAYAKERIRLASADLPKLEAKRDELLKKIADDYDEEHGR